jgi:outer membrane biosynthesis protein TonB
MNNDKTLYPLIISLILHFIFIYVFFFGLPHLFEPLPADKRIITVEVLPISELANVKTKKAQKEKKLEAETSKKVEKSKTEQKQDTKQQEDKAEKKEPEKKVAEQPKKESLNKDKVKVKEKEKPKAKPKEKPKQVKKQDVKKEKKDQPKDQKKNNESDLDSLLKTLEESSEGEKDAKTKKKARSESTEVGKEAEGIFDETQPESIDYQSLLRRQIEENWNPPIGVVDKAFAVKFNIRYNIDGSLIDYKLIDKNCNALDASTCTALIDSAQRAITAANPIKDVDSARYNEWNEINYTFTPQSFR